MIFVNCLSHVFKYVDRFYVKRTHKRGLKAAGDYIFVQTAFRPFFTAISDAILDTVDRFRDGACDADMNIVQRVVDIMDMDIYAEFESCLIRRAVQYYNRCAATHADDSFMDYVTFVDLALNREDEGVAPRFHAQTLPKLVRVCNDSMLVWRHDKAVDCLLRQKRIGDMERVFRVFSRVPDGPEALAELVHKYVVECGRVRNHYQPNPHARCMQCEPGGLRAVPPPPHPATATHPVFPTAQVCHARYERE